jgi:uncharacterized protein
MNAAIQRLTYALEVKSLDDAGRLEGYASVFGNVDHGGDVVLPGAFRQSLAQHAKSGAWPPMFWSHQPDAVPGVWTHMEEDDKGLRVRGQLVNTDLGQDVRTLLKSKAVRGLSIGFSTMPNGVDFDRDGHRILKALELWEVSIVSLPMNPAASVDTVKAQR